MLRESPWQVPDGHVTAEQCRVEYELRGVRWEVDAADAADVPFELCAPARSFPAWPRKRHYSGLLWMELSGRHVAFESLAERSCLIELDRTPGVVAVSSQPMWIKWARQPVGEHAPDYFVRLADGSGLVIDVRPLERVDDEARVQFGRTAVVCRDQGWGYRVYAPESKVRDANLRFLMRYRDRRWHQEDGAATFVGMSGTIGELATRVDADGDGLARCFALIWSGRLHVDLEQPLSLRSVVQWKETA